MTQSFNDGRDGGPAGFGGPVPFGAMPLGGTKISRVEVHTFPNGDVVEFRHVKTSRMDAEGNLEVSERTEVFPPLADGTAPKDVSEIVQCFACQCVLSKCSTVTCQVCKEMYCRRHAVEIALEDQKVVLCQACATPVPEKSWWARLRDFLLEGTDATR